MSLLEISDLGISFGRGRRRVDVVDHVNLALEAGQMLALVGESGSGKSLTATAVNRLLPYGGWLSGGHIRLAGRDLADLPEREMRAVRGREIGMVFQNPLSAMNPSLTVARQIGESYRLYTGASEQAARERALELLREVGVPDAAARLDDYPHQFSGGMRQRVMIAMALTCEPKLLIADEPTTALDVTIQAQILRLIRRLQHERDLAVIFITHDLSLVAEYADRVAVMYAGRIVEQASADEFFATPQHPYSRALLAAIPRVDGEPARLADIDGLPPDPRDFPPGCRFAPRCPQRQDRCTQAYPETLYSGGHGVACFRAQELPA
ncbi:methionine ABC transporter ATP-binding protein [Acidihalobacter aeolianus]|uniref:ABC-type dipeptide transporter n=1 Tax=Acidihalobacter aeolianus TaxID=2792603 RepID=A0A1D8K9Q9_9GAMM|nr:ABC transporter ATP-binding protein [Acidihalobacter aeolianus]AOV17671.1 methionine ABC transporter ATP-binding protein [Acidihalobacter aeolianus]